MEILHDIPEPRLLDYFVVPAPALESDAVNGFASLSAMRSDATHIAPLGLDVPRFRDILEAKRSAAEDHAWALREDPAYFMVELRVM